MVRHMLRLVVSTTRAAIFKRRSRSVANSAVADSRALGMASRTVSINQKAVALVIIWICS